jgi:hypothetical protein
VGGAAAKADGGGTSAEASAGPAKVVVLADTKTDPDDAQVPTSGQAQTKDAPAALAAPSVAEGKADPGRDQAPAPGLAKAKAEEVPALVESKLDQSQGDPAGAPANAKAADARPVLGAKSQSTPDTKAASEGQARDVPALAETKAGPSQGPAELPGLAEAAVPVVADAKADQGRDHTEAPASTPAVTRDVLAETKGDQAQRPAEPAAQAKDAPPVVEVKADGGREPTPASAETRTNDAPPVAEAKAEPTAASAEAKAAPVDAARQTKAVDVASVPEGKAEPVDAPVVAELKAEPTAASAEAKAAPVDAPRQTKAVDVASVSEGRAESVDAPVVAEIKAAPIEASGEAKDAPLDAPKQTKAADVASVSEGRAEPVDAPKQTKAVEVASVPEGRAEPVDAPVVAETKGEPIAASSDGKTEDAARSADATVKPIQATVADATVTEASPGGGASVDKARPPAEAASQAQAHEGAQATAASPSTGKGSVASADQVPAVLPGAETISIHVPDLWPGGADKPGKTESLVPAPEKAAPLVLDAPDFTGATGAQEAAAPAATKSGSTGGDAVSSITLGSGEKGGVPDSVSAKENALAAATPSDAAGQVGAETPSLAKVGQDQAPAATSSARGGPTQGHESGKPIPFDGAAALDIGAAAPSQGAAPPGGGTASKVSVPDGSDAATALAFPLDGASHPVANDWLL